MSDFLVNSKIDEIFRHVSILKLEKFKNSSAECLAFPKFLKESHRKSIESLTSMTSLEYRTSYHEGCKQLKVYKNCYSGEFLKATPTIKLTETSQKVIFKYLNESSLSERDQHDLLPDKLKINVRSDKEKELKIPIHRFCGSIGQNLVTTIPPINSNFKYSYERTQMPIYKYRADILDSIKQYNVVILASNTCMGKSTQVPQYILEDAATKNLHCRIVSVQACKIAVLSHSETVAAQRAEQIGLSVGFQVQLESVSSTSTNVLFTTSNYFLRCRIGNSIKESFSGITHLIVDDVHLRNSYTDILLQEIKEALVYYPDMKVILIMNPINYDVFTQYFNNVFVLQLESVNRNVYVYKLEDVLLLTNYVNEEMKATITCPISMNCFKPSYFQHVVDNSIDSYFISGSDTCFDNLLYLIEGENVSINAQHSITKITVLMAAAKNSCLRHLIQIVKLNANIFLTDSFNKSALCWAQQSTISKPECVQYLNEVMLQQIGNKSVQDDSLMQKLISNYQESLQNFQGVDQQLVFNTINYIHQTTEDGTILVFMPSFDDILQQEFIINKNVSAGFMKANIKTYLLHENLHLNDYKEILKKEESLSNSSRKIILSSDIGESTLTVKDAVYVIDCGKQFEQIQINGGARNMKYGWISRESCIRRSLLAGIEKDGYCFRLYTEKVFVEQMDKFNTPKMLTTNLTKECLYIKLFSPKINITEYFSRAIAKPSDDNIKNSIKFLKTIGAFNGFEAITLLGVHLIDLPVDPELGKVLIFAIVLQCLDPVLTIVSMLSYQDPCILPSQQSSKEQIVLSRQKLAEGTNSDHLVLLRIYQKWQNDKLIGTENLFHQDNFILNGALESISYIRSQIIGALRATGLIHSMGMMSMHFININASKWSLVKACFVAGLYPNFAIIARNGKPPSLKSNQQTKLLLHPTSVLRDLNPVSFQYLIESYQTDWIMFHEKSLAGNYNQAKCATIIHPLAIALFAGNFQMSASDDLIPLSNEEADDVTGGNGKGAAAVKTKKIRYIIDEYISFILDEDDAYLLFALRQTFFSLLLLVLQFPDDPEKLRNIKCNLSAKFSCIHPITHVLLLEDLACNLHQPEKVGERPKAISLPFVPDIQTKNLTSATQSFESLTLSNYNNNNCIAKAKTSVDIDNGIFYVMKVSSEQRIRNFFDKSIWLGTPHSWMNLVKKYLQFPKMDIFIFVLIADSARKTTDGGGGDYDVNINFFGIARFYKNADNDYSLEWIIQKDVSINELKLCSLTITRLSLLSPLPADLTSLSLAVKMQSSKRTLRSHEIPVPQSAITQQYNTVQQQQHISQCSIGGAQNNQSGGNSLIGGVTSHGSFSSNAPLLETELDLHFSLQYPHFIKRDGNRLLILLQRRKKYKTRTILGYKTLAEGIIRMDAVLQKSMDMTVELTTTGKSGRPGTTVATLRAERVSSIPVDHDNKNNNSVLLTDRVTEYSDDDEEGDFSSGEDNDDGTDVGLSGYDGGGKHGYASKHELRKYRKLERSENEDVALGPNPVDSDSEFEMKEKGSRAKISRQRNFKQKIVALLKRFKVSEELDGRVTRGTGTLRGERELDALFQELESLSCGEGDDSGPDLDSLSVGSTPKPSLRPFFSNSRSMLHDNIMGDGGRRASDKSDTTIDKKMISATTPDRGPEWRNDSSGNEGNAGNTDPEAQNSDPQNAGSPPREKDIIPAGVITPSEKRSRLFRTSSNTPSTKKKQSLSLSAEPKSSLETCLSPTNVEPRKLLLDQLQRVFSMEEALLPDVVAIISPTEPHGGILAPRLNTILSTSFRPAFAPQNTAEVKAVLQALMTKIQKYCNNTAKPPATVKVLLLGGDWLQGAVLRHYVDLLGVRPPDWVNHIRFYIVPVGSSATSRYLSAVDQSYCAMFGTENWHQLCERATNSDSSLVKSDIIELTNRIQRYLHTAGPCTQIPIAEAMVHYKDEDSCQIFVPFISDVRIGFPEGPQLSLDLDETSSVLTQQSSQGTALSSSPPLSGRNSPPMPTTPAQQNQESVELQIDYWAIVRPGEAKEKTGAKSGDQGKNSIKSTFRNFQVWRLSPNPQAGEISPGLTVNFAIKEKKQKIMRLGKKKEKDRDSEKEQCVEGVSRIICSPKQSHPVPLRGRSSSYMPSSVYIDGTEWTGVKFFQLSSQWQTHVKNFPVALVGAQISCSDIS